MAASFKTFEIGYFVYIPGRYVVCLHISLSSKGFCRPDMLASIFNVFAELNVPIVSIKIPKPGLSENAELSVFADLTESRNVLRKLVEKIRSLRFIEKVEAIEPLFKGFTVDTTYSQPTLAGGRVIILREPAYEGFIKGLKKRFGSVGKEFLYYIGLDMGYKVFKAQSKIIRKAGGGLKELLVFLKEVFKHSGLGIVEHIDIDFDNKTAIIRVQNSFECRLFKESGNVESHVIRGFIAGFMSSLFKTKVNVIETKCIAKGDPYCEFTVF